MTRVTKKAKIVYKAIDLLLCANIRILDRGEIERTNWYDDLNACLKEEIKKTDLDEKKNTYIKHYVLCLVQIYSWSYTKNKKELITAAYIYCTESFSIKTRKEDIEYQSKINENIGLRLISERLSSLKLDVNIILMITNNLLSNPKLYFGSVSPEYFVDLVLNAYVLENPMSPLDLLAYAKAHDLISTETVVKGAGSKPITCESIVRLGLYQEFNEIAFHVWEFNTRKEIKINQDKLCTVELTKTYSDDRDIVESMGVTQETATINTKLIETELGMRVLESALKGYKGHKNRLGIYMVCPGSDQLTGNDISDILFYATKEHKMQILVNKETGSPYRIGKIISLICSYYVDICDFKMPVKTPVFNKEKAGSLTELTSEMVKRKYGVTVAKKTLYLAYKDNWDGLYLRVIYDWNIFCNVFESGMEPWFEVQCHCSNIIDLLRAKRPSHSHEDIKGPVIEFDKYKVTIKVKPL